MNTEGSSDWTFCSAVHNNRPHATPQQTPKHVLRYKQRLDPAPPPVLPVQLSVEVGVVLAHVIVFGDGLLQLALVLPNVVVKLAHLRNIDMQTKNGLDWWAAKVLMRVCTCM